MKRKAISFAAAATITAVAIGIGASAYTLEAVISVGQNNTTEAGTSTALSSINMLSTTTTMNAMISTKSQNAVTSSSTNSSSQSSPGETASLQIAADHVSPGLSGAAVDATCGLAMPAQGASYLEVTNNGTAPTVIDRISFNYALMAMGSGVPMGDCAVAVGATVYITLTGIGMNMATAGETFTVELSGSNGGFVSAGGKFG
jgi:hypothetical protein